MFTIVAADGTIHTVPKDRLEFQMGTWETFGAGVLRLIVWTKPPHSITLGNYFSVAESKRAMKWVRNFLENPDSTVLDAQDIARDCLDPVEKDSDPGCTTK